MTPRLTPERIVGIRRYTTDNSGNRWWSEFGLGDALVFVEELLDGIDALAAEADRYRQIVDRIRESDDEDTLGSIKIYDERGNTLGYLRDVAVLAIEAADTKETK